MVRLVYLLNLDHFVHLVHLAHHIHVAHLLNYVHLFFLVRLVLYPTSPSLSGLLGGLCAFHFTINSGVTFRTFLVANETVLKYFFSGIPKFSKNVFPGISVTFEFPFQQFRFDS